MNGMDGFIDMLILAGLPEPEREYRFAPPRKWRFDYCWIAQRVALEYEGGIYSGGRHVRGKGYANDCRKYTEASLRGWVLIRVTSEMIGNGEALRFIERALGKEVSKPRRKKG